MCLQNEETHYFPAQRKEEEIHSKAHLHKTSEHRGQKENPKSFQTDKRLLIRIKKKKTGFTLLNSKTGA